MSIIPIEYGLYRMSQDVALSYGYDPPPPPITDHRYRRITYHEVAGLLHCCTITLIDRRSPISTYRISTVRDTMGHFLVGLVRYNIVL